MGRLAILALTGIVLAGQPANAQFVRLPPGGGVTVRAPFVHVEVAPGGSTYVRAPFTSINTPGLPRLQPGYEAPYRSRPVISTSPTTRLRPLTAEEFAQGMANRLPLVMTDPARMNWRDLRTYARSAALRLESGLKRTPGGTSWTTSLRPGTIRDLLAEDVNQPPDPSTSQQLQSILQSYNALADSNGYPQITQLEAFEDLHHALAELVLPAKERARHGLLVLWAALQDDLRQFDTGSTWQAYLELPKTLSEGTTDTEHQLQQAEELLARFRQVEGPDKYRAVTQLASFRSARDALVDYARLLSRNETSTTSTTSTPEVIPPPQPLP